MEEVNMNGEMEECMKVNINLIKNMDMAVINGKMGEDILDNGLIVKEMEKEKQQELMAHKNREFGKMTKD